MASPDFIPRNVVNDLLLGCVRRDVIKRFTPNIDVVSDVWVAFASNLREQVRVLIAPVDGVSAADIGYVLHDCIRAYRETDEARDYANGEKREATNISPLENFVAVWLYLDELVRVVLPLTKWWSERNLSALSRKDKNSSALQRMLEDEIKATLSKEEEQKIGPAKKRDRQQRRITDAAPLAALIGLLVATAGDAHLLDSLDRTPNADYRVWLKDKIDIIARTAVKTLAVDVLPCLLKPKLSRASEQAAKQADPDAKPPLALIYRVFLDRQAELAAADGVNEGVSTIKADAADRLFGISCQNLTWGIIDSGIAANHPAFNDHGASSKQSRVRAILDFTLIEHIRNFDLIADKAGSPEREQAIGKVVEKLKALPDLPAEPDFEKMARENLRLIAAQLERRLQPDWNLIEPLI